jgi:hypothetical protein
MRGRNNARAIVASLLFVVVIGWIAWLIASSETFSDCVRQGDTLQTYQSSLKLPVSIVRVLDGARLGGSCAIRAANEYQGAMSAIAALVMVVFTAMLWTAMSAMLKAADAQTAGIVRSAKASEESAAAARESVELSRHAFVVQNTAYVTPLTFRVERSVDATTGRIAEWRFAPQWQNTGNTPATHVRHMTNAKLFPVDGMPSDFDFPDNQRTGPDQSLGKMIGPSSTIPGPLCSIDIATFRGIRNRYRLFIWCWIEYRDVFSGTPIRRTEWCSELVLLGDPTDPRLSSEILFRLDLADRFNGADDDCYRRPGQHARLIPISDLEPAADTRVPQSDVQSFTVSYPGLSEVPARSEP